MFYPQSLWVIDGVELGIAVIMKLLAEGRPVVRPPPALPGGPPRRACRRHAARAARAAGPGDRQGIK